MKVLKKKKINNNITYNKSCNFLIIPSAKVLDKVKNKKQIPNKNKKKENKLKKQLINKKSIKKAEIWRKSIK